MHATNPVETKISITEQNDSLVDRIGGYLPVLEVPLDYPRSPGSSLVTWLPPGNAGATEAIEIDRKLCL